MYTVRRNMLIILSIGWMVASSVAFLPNIPTSTLDRVSTGHQSGSRLLLSGLFGEQAILDRKRGASESSVDWEIYVDHSRSSLDRGASATLDAFCGLCPPSKVRVIPAILPNYNNKKTPWVRCISKVPGRTSIDVAGVDSIDKVYRLLSKHLQVKEVTRDNYICLKWKYKGKSHLEAGKVALAIDAFDKALEKCIGEKQEGAILLLRASAYLQQAQSHKTVLQGSMEEWRLPLTQDIQHLLSEALLGGPERTGLANSILRKLNSDGKRQQSELKKIQFHHGLYQYSLLHGLQDSLRATGILPNYSSVWLRAGEILSQLWKLEESRQYYEKALSLDPDLEERLEPILHDLKRRKDLLEQARANKDWPEDSLRLALDVAG